MGGVEYQMSTVPLLDIPAPVRLRRPKQEAAKENEIRWLRRNIVLCSLAYPYVLCFRIHTGIRLDANFLGLYSLTETRYDIFERK